MHIRNAQRQVGVLNRELEGVRFGTVRGMKIRLSRDDRPKTVCRKLQEPFSEATSILMRDRRILSMVQKQTSKVR